MESLLRSVDAREPSLDSVRSGPLLLLKDRDNDLLRLRTTPTPPRAPQAHLGWPAVSRERPRMSRLRPRGLGTGLGALAFLHQMAKPPMSLRGGAVGSRGPWPLGTPIVCRRDRRPEEKAGVRGQGRRWRPGVLTPLAGTQALSWSSH